MTQTKQIKPQSQYMATPELYIVYCLGQKQSYEQELTDSINNYLACIGKVRTNKKYVQKYLDILIGKGFVTCSNRGMPIAKKNPNLIIFKLSKDGQELLAEINEIGLINLLRDRDRRRNEILTELTIRTMFVALAIVGLITFVKIF